MIAAVSVSAYRSARRAAAFRVRSDMAVLTVSGRDRASFLHALFTNDIANLEPGRGCYSAYLTPQGRMIADLVVHELGDAILVTLDRGVRDGVLRKLNDLVFAEEVDIRDSTDSLAQVAVIGPQTEVALARVLGGVTSDSLLAMPDHANTSATLDREPVAIARTDELGENAFDVFVAAAHAPRLIAALADAGLPELDSDTAEAIRIEGAVPKFGLDMDEQTIPLEAGIESRAISFTKGCYVGQEVIVRVLHRGHGRVAKRLVGLILAGDRVPEGGTIVRADVQEVGRITSATLSPALGRPIALAYVQRDFVAPGTRLQVDGAPATVTATPFVAPSR
jgi:folate-binding protein YgfZ